MKKYEVFPIDVSIKRTMTELYFDLDSVESLYVGSGVVCEICYNLNTIHYEAENNNQFSELNEKYSNWQNLQADYKALLKSGKSKFNGEVEQARIKADQAYHQYLNQLEYILEKLQLDGETYYAL